MFLLRNKKDISIFRMKKTDERTDTFDSCYLEVQGTLKYFEISVPQHIRIADLRKNKLNNHI